MEYKSTSAICQNCKQDFTIEPNDFGFYEKINVPPPTFCPDCRRARRWAWRNNMSLYSRKCASCDKNVVSLYAPDSSITIYCNKCWWSDKWDPKSYGVEYDFSQPFFYQFKELINGVPHMSVVNDDGIASLNCEYTHDWWFSKNCYMCFSGWRTENVMYSYFILSGKDIMDSMNLISKNEFIYECFRCRDLYRIKYAQYSRSCVNSAFLFDCANCADCFMCVGLRNQKYHFKNKEYKKEEYEKILMEYGLDTFSGLEKAKKEFRDFALTFPHRYVMTLQNVNCTGDNLSTSKNSKDAFVAKNLENCRYIDQCANDKDSFDLTTTGEVSECYECAVGDHSQLNLFGLFSVKSQDIKYCQHCHNCKHCFGCVGLRDANYCIFNKQYTKEEYEELVPKIIEQMNAMPYRDKMGNIYRYGEFYPIELSPFGYNESYAPELVPLAKEEALERGYNWQDNIQRTTGKETLLSENIPESIHDINDSILEEVLSCIECKRNYKIVPNELIFYKKMEIPIPRKCFYCRYVDRIKKRNPLKLWHRTCMCEQDNHEHQGKCAVGLESSFSLDRPEVIYCEKCYQKEVY
ncbi:MAG: hypothetical protein WC783_01730 [Candidatus Paceibacterota bacterium]